MIQLSRGRTYDPTTGEATADGRVTRLEPQPAALLALLTARPDVLVTHEEIRGHLWPDGRHVDYAAGVHYSMRQIRKALGEGTGWDREIETLPRRGYRLRAAALSPRPAPCTLEAPASARPPNRWSGRRLGWVAAGLVAAALVALVEQRPNDHHTTAVALARAVHDALY